MDTGKLDLGLLGEVAQNVGNLCLQRSRALASLEFCMHQQLRKKVAAIVLMDVGLELLHKSGGDLGISPEVSLSDLTDSEPNALAKVLADRHPWKAALMRRIGANSVPFECAQNALVKLAGARLQISPICLEVPELNHVDIASLMEQVGELARQIERLEKQAIGWLAQPDSAAKEQACTIVYLLETSREILVSAVIDLDLQTEIPSDCLHMLTPQMVANRHFTPTVGWAACQQRTLRLKGVSSESIHDALVLSAPVRLKMARTAFELATREIQHVAA